MMRDARTGLVLLHLSLEELVGLGDGAGVGVHVLLHALGIQLAERPVHPLLAVRQPPADMDTRTGVRDKPGRIRATSPTLFH